MAPQRTQVSLLIAATVAASLGAGTAFADPEPEGASPYGPDVCVGLELLRNGLDHGAGDWANCSPDALLSAARVDDGVRSLLNQRYQCVGDKAIGCIAVPGAMRIR